MRAVSFGLSQRCQDQAPFHFRHRQTHQGFSSIQVRLEVIHVDRFLSLVHSVFSQTNAIRVVPNG